MQGNHLHQQRRWAACQSIASESSLFQTDHFASAAIPHGCCVRTFQTLCNSEYAQFEIVWQTQTLTTTSFHPLHSWIISLPNQIELPCFGSSKFLLMYTRAQNDILWQSLTKMLTSRWVNKSASDVSWPVVPPAALLPNTAGPGQQWEAEKT